MAELGHFKGAWVALITPLKNNQIDAAGLEKVIEHVIAGGVHGIVPCGTTGESPTLSHAEHKQVVELAIKIINGRVPVMAGAGSNNTAEAVDFAQHAKDVGADATLQVSPYYNKPTQEGLIEHFTAVADEVALPHFIYNIPGRSVVDVTDETLAQLLKHKHIAGIKDATGDLARVATLRAIAPDDAILLSGEDMTAVGFNAMGGQGCISVTANVAPAECAAVQNACLSGNFLEATLLQDELVTLHNSMFMEPSPIPVKFAASKLGLCDEEVRLPLTKCTRPTRDAVKKAMKQAGLL